MTEFNWQNLKWAKNINDVSIDVAIIFVRKAWSNWEYVEVPSTSNTNVTADWTSIIDIFSESRWTATKLADLLWNISFDLLENAWVDLFAKFLGLDVTSNASWATVITDREMTFEWDTIEFNEISNDDAWVTSIVVKDSTWTTTYVLDTDYEIELVWNITRIKNLGAGITDDDTVLVSWTVNLNANETANYVSTYTQLPALDFRVAVEKTEWGVKKYKIINGKSMTLNSTYVFPFLNAVQAWAAQNTSLQFDLDRDSEFEIINEIL